MGSLGPQLDSAIEAAIRMLEGSTDAVRHDDGKYFWMDLIGWMDG